MASLADQSPLGFSASFSHQGSLPTSGEQALSKSAMLANKVSRVTVLLIINTDSLSSEYVLILSSVDFVIRYKD